MQLELLLYVALDLLDRLLDDLFVWCHTLDPASVVSHDILVKNLADSQDFSVDAVLLEVVVDSKVDFDLLDGVDPLIESVLGLVDLSEAALSNEVDFVEKPVVSVLFKIFRKPVVIGILLAPENQLFMNVLTIRRMFCDSDHRDLLTNRIIGLGRGKVALLWLNLVLGFERIYCWLDYRFEFLKEWFSISWRLDWSVLFIRRR